MKINILGLIICIFIVSISCNNNSTNAVDSVKQYIKKNELPITIGEEIIINNDFNFTDKTKFQLYTMDLLNTLSNNISEGNFDDNTIENYKKLEKIIAGYYEYCFKNNYELAIIFKNTKNVLIEYLEYYGYIQTYYNDFVVLDNNTSYEKLKDLIKFSLKIGDIARINIINYFLHDWNGKDSNNGWLIKNDIDLVSEVILMNASYNMIGEIIYLLKIKGYDKEEYENTLEEINRKKDELRILTTNHTDKHEPILR